MSQDTELKRALNLPLLVLYGLGTIIGAGIYVLIGEVVAVAGMRAPVAFFAAAVLASLSAFSLAELSSRYPRSAGEAIYVKEGITPFVLPVIVGLMVAMVGMVSAATIANGFVGYLETFIQIPDVIAITLLILLLGLLAIWGIAESVAIAALITVIEVAGLLFIIVAAGSNLPPELPPVSALLPTLSPTVWSGVMAGAFLAFYAFIGFEDMVNVAEEVKDVRRTLPRAIVIALVLATILYGAIATVAVLIVPVDQLGLSSAPLADIYTKATGRSPELISAISLVAVINGALIQIIMASRILYGLRNEWLPLKIFGYVNPKTRTPVFATLASTLITLILALIFDLVNLAKTTTAITLTVFVLINVALIRIKLKHPKPTEAFVVPIWIPVTGALISALFLVFELFLA